jgi:hypothetical protein
MAEVHNHPGIHAFFTAGAGVHGPVLPQLGPTALDDRRLITTTPWIRLSS